MGNFAKLLGKFRRSWFLREVSACARGVKVFTTVNRYYFPRLVIEFLQEAEEHRRPELRLTSLSNNPLNLHWLHRQGCVNPWSLTMLP